MVIFDFLHIAQPYNTDTNMNSVIRYFGALTFILSLYFNVSTILSLKSVTLSLRSAGQIWPRQDVEWSPKSFPNPQWAFFLYFYYTLRCFYTAVILYVFGQFISRLKFGGDVIAGPVFLLVILVSWQHCV